MSASTEKKNRQLAREAGTDKKTLAAQEAAAKKKKTNRRWTISTVAVLVVIALVIFLNTSFLYKHTTALSVNGESFSPAEVSYYYSNHYYDFLNQYGDYAMMFGLNPQMGIAGLDEQPCPMLGEEGGSWRDYFLQMTENELLQTRAILAYAAENGIALDESELQEMKDSFSGMDEAARIQGFGSADKFFAANFGKGVDSELVLKAGIDTSVSAKAVQSVMETLNYSSSELEDYYKSLNGENDSLSYAFFNVLPEKVESSNEAGETVSEANDETRAAAREQAQAIMAAYKDSEGENYSDRLSEAAAGQIEGASATVRENIPASSSAEYKEWLLGSRKAGDVTVIEAANGDTQSVVVFLSRSDNHYPMVSVRHILVRATPAEDGSYSEEAKEAAKTRAEEILAEFNAGDKTEESFAALANQYSEDPGSNTNGGLYENIFRGQMVEEFDRFCFEGHKTGDTGIVYGESGGVPGYHVIYFVGEGQLYSDYIAENALTGRDMDQWLSDISEGYTIERGYGIRFVG